MAKTTSSFLFIFCVFQCLFFIGGNAHIAPVMYVFGDSLSDVGNNMFILGTRSKPNYKPYGIDFPNGTFGRFTNGFTLAEHLAKLLKLPLPLPVLDPRSKNTSCIQGFNYASNSAGILPDTGVKLAVANLCLKKQVQLFKKTTQEFLPSRLRSQQDIMQHIEKSIFFILIGANDFTLNYEPPFSKNSQIYKPEQFAKLLVNKLGDQIQKLYKLGARKFVVSEIAPFGCTPGAIMFLHPKTRCVEQQNSYASMFNDKLSNKTRQLSKNLKAASFVTMKADFLAKLMKHPKLYGFKNAVYPCCTVGGPGEVQCLPNVPPCQNRQSYVFFDAIHTTNAVNKVIAKACFNNDEACSPISINQLLKQC